MEKQRCWGHLNKGGDLANPPRSTPLSFSTRLSTRKSQIRALVLSLVNDILFAVNVGSRKKLKSLLFQRVSMSGQTTGSISATPLAFLLFLFLPSFLPFSLSSFFLKNKATARRRSSG